MDDILLAKYAQELLSNLLAIYEKTFDSLAAEIISTVTTLLQSIFSVPIASVTATTSYGVKGDFAIKSLRPYQEFKDGCEEIAFYENNSTKRNKSTGQDYIRSRDTKWQRRQRGNPFGRQHRKFSFEKAFSIFFSVMAVFRW